MYRNVCLSLLAAVVILATGTAGAQSVIATIPVGNGPSAIVYDSIDHKVFVAVKGLNSVAVINAETNTVDASIPVGQQPVAICWNKTSNKIYAAGGLIGLAGTVTIINAATNQVIDSISVGAEPMGIMWTSQLNKVYCLNRLGNSLSVIDGATNQWLTEIYFPDRIPNDFIYNPSMDRIYLSCADQPTGGRVRAIDCARDSILRTISAGPSAWSLAYNPVNNLVYCHNRGPRTISIINCQNNTATGTVSNIKESHALLWIPSNKLYASEYWEGYVAHLPGDSTRVHGWTGVVQNGTSMLYNPNTNKIFCSGDLAGIVTVIDPRDGHDDTIMTLPMGGGAGPMALSQDNDRIYVANAWDTTVTVIQDVVGIEEGAGPARPRSVVSVRSLPNPAVSGMAVEFRVTGFDPARLEIRDAGGRLVHAATASSSLRWQAPVSGVYFCTASSGQTRTTCKLTVR